MSSITNFLQQCAACWQGQKYELLPKKDDDLGIEEAKIWVQNHPIDTTISALSYEKVKAYGWKIFKDFSKVRLTPANIDILKSHLVLIAKESESVRRILVDNVLILRDDFWGLKRNKEKEPLVNAIHTALNFTCTYKL